MLFKIQTMVFIIDFKKLRSIFWFFPKNNSVFIEEFTITYFKILDFLLFYTHEPHNYEALYF